ncbi:hypothetical protein QLQ12_06940 [Actinoplanes sp. NEAU-A12]|uniref:Uncharacterized protein n=1 Tax=Actinoplanes sandaracinus TaxID=3045177 RepID=A0ABT6WF18_9ACTN|nr:hypothetical protein [Actinoplanes sandaracinus]MDI6098336.1 hypothetical protein [Actinoplanes sandaracinus]
MRHVRSIFYALVLGPSIWVLCGVGFTRDLSSRGRELFAPESFSGLLLLLFGGILFAILTFAPVSPVGPVLAGAVYLGVTFWAWNSPQAYASLWAPEIAKENFDLSRPGYGLAAVLAIPLLGTALSARRWARYEPPVLPIIGEIGRFRGAAKVVGTPVAAEQTTVIRTGAPGMPATVDADRTVAFNGGSDRTIAFHAGAGSDRTAVIASAEPTMVVADNNRTAVVADNDRTVFVVQPPAAPSPAPAPLRPAPAAESEPTAPRIPPAAPKPAPEPEPVTVLAPPSASKPAPGSEPTTVLAIVSDKAATAGKPEAVTPAAPEPAAPVAAAPEPAAPVAAAPEPAASVEPVSPVEKDEDTFVLAGPREDRTQASVADADPTRPLLLPAKAGPSAAADEPTVPGEPVTPPEQETEPLRLPTEPTVVIPAQRRPPAIES